MRAICAKCRSTDVVSLSTERGVWLLVDAKARALPPAPPARPPGISDLTVLVASSVLVGIIVLLGYLAWRT
jgi:hypothetical protein